jgi:DNA-binding MarR family transcriptional regulator
MGVDKEESVTQWIHDNEIPAALISYSYRTIQKSFARELAPYHIGWGHFAILMAVHEMDGPSQESIALSRGFDKTMVAKSVAKLEKEDFVYRENDEADKRVKRLYLTEKSKNLRPEMERIGRGINKKLIKDFDENESKIILKYLRKIALNTSEM